jgi:hypothetical protein
LIRQYRSLARASRGVHDQTAMSPPASSGERARAYRFGGGTQAEYQGTLVYARRYPAGDKLDDGDLDHHHHDHHR